MAMSRIRTRLAGYSPTGAFTAGGASRASQSHIDWLRYSQSARKDAKSNTPAGWPRFIAGEHSYQSPGTPVTQVSCLDKPDQRGKRQG